MKNVGRSLLVGSLCVGMLAGCSKAELTGALSDTVSSMGTTSSTNLLDKGVSSAKNGDMTAATGYFTSWYALQSDKAVARQQLQNLAKLHANDAAGKAVNTALNKL